MLFELVAKLNIPNVIHAFLVDYGIKSKNNLITYNLTNEHLCSTIILRIHCNDLLLQWIVNNDHIMYVILSIIYQYVVLYVSQNLSHLTGYKSRRRISHN
jgi:hypothetical protein